VSTIKSSFICALFATILRLNKDLLNNLFKSSIAGGDDILVDQNKPAGFMPEA